MVRGVLVPVSQKSKFNNFFTVMLLVHVVVMKRVLSLLAAWSKMELLSSWSIGNVSGRVVC